MPSKMIRFVTLIDYEHEVFVGPLYGQRGDDAVSRLLLSGHDVASESVLIAHVHAEFLRLAMIAFLFFHRVSDFFPRIFSRLLCIEISGFFNGSKQHQMLCIAPGTRDV